MITQDIIETYNSMKTNRDASALFLTLDSANQNLILLDKADINTSYQDIIAQAQLPKDDIRFLVINFVYETDENPPRKTERLLLIQWIPITAPMRRKFAVVNSTNDLKLAFIGIQKDFKISDFSELDYEYIRRDCLKA
ncbi:MAG: hypothetical protein NTW85_06975 [Methylococcales bacterium]|nr:hypothetical protein [Methylococcales bacterium]